MTGLANKIKYLNTLMETCKSPAEFRREFRRKLGVTTHQKLITNDRNVTELVPVEKFNANSPDREFDHNDFQFGEIMQNALKADWRTKFENSYQDSCRVRFNVIGSSSVNSDAPYTSAAVDVIAGLVNARALARPQSPKYIGHEFCKEEEIVGEGGFLIGKRADFTQPINTDLPKDAMPPTVKLTETRVHRNRPKKTGVQLMLNKFYIADDLTGQAMEAVDEYSDIVLVPKENKIADANLGIGGTSGYLIPGQTQTMKIIYQEAGLGGYPYQASAVATVSPENGKQVLNFVNCVNSDVIGLADYTILERAMYMLENVDPFTSLPVATDFNGMMMWVHPRSYMQAERILNVKRQWRTGSTSITTALGSMADGPNPLEPYGIKLRTSQLWAKRLTDVGIGSGGMTHAFSDTYTTAGSALSLYLIGHFQQGTTYFIREPYTAQELQLTGDDVAMGTALRMWFNENGEATNVNPRCRWRAYA